MVVHTFIACYIPKATNTHSGYVVRNPFPLQQWLGYISASMSRYTCIACLFPNRRQAVTFRCLESRTNCGTRDYVITRTCICLPPNLFCPYIPFRLSHLYVQSDKPRLKHAVPQVKFWCDIVSAVGLPVCGAGRVLYVRTDPSEETATCSFRCKLCIFFLRLDIFIHRKRKKDKIFSNYRMFSAFCSRFTGLLLVEKIKISKHYGVSIAYL